MDYSVIEKRCISLVHIQQCKQYHNNFMKNIKVNCNYIVFILLLLLSIIRIQLVFNSIHESLIPVSQLGRKNQKKEKCVHENWKFPKQWTVREATLTTASGFHVHSQSVSWASGYNRRYMNRYPGRHDINIQRECVWEGKLSNRDSF